MGCFMLIYSEKRFICIEKRIFERIRVHFDRSNNCVDSSIEFTFRFNVSSIDTHYQEGGNGGANIFI